MPLIVALGDLLMDITVQPDRPLTAHTHSFAQASISPGGSAANFAVWASRLGAESALIARVGADLLGHALLDDLQREGVTSGVTVGGETTGTLLTIQNADGPPTLLAARGANAALSRSDLDWELLDRAELLHVSAYSFLEESPREAALAAMQYVRERGGLLSLDPASHGYVERTGVEAFLYMTRGVDLFFPNWEEGRALTGEEDPERIVHALLRHFPLVALKLGAEGAIAGSGDRMVHQPGLPVPVVDTIGAGDAFAAAFVVTWLRDHDLAAALYEGNRIAAGVVQAVGARPRVGPPSSSHRTLSH